MTHCKRYFIVFSISSAYSSPPRMPSNRASAQLPRLTDFVHVLHNLRDGQRGSEILVMNSKTWTEAIRVPCCRYESDIQLAKSLGINVFRLSLEWHRCAIIRSKGARHAVEEGHDNCCTHGIHWYLCNAAHLPANGKRLCNA
jgi:hypothetical protein